MKKIIFLFIISAFFITGANAQFSFGVKGGLTVSDMNLDVFPDTVMDPIFGYNGGIFFKFVEGLFSFQPEVMFVRKGTMKNHKGSDWYQQFSTNYIDVPLLARISIDLKVVELYVNLGPYVGYLMSAKVKERTFDDGTNQWVTNDYKYDFNNTAVETRWDAGIVMGVGVRVLMVIFEVRYNTGLVNIGNKDLFDSSKNKYLSLSLGVQF